MANTVSIISYGNTFGELVTNLNAVARENNALAANNYTKDSGTLFLNDTGLGLQVANNAIIEGGLTVNYGLVENNLRVDHQLYLTNTTIGLVNSGQANVYGLLFANASGNSIISTNNVTVGGNTFITGNVYSSNNLVIAGRSTIGGISTLLGTTNVANTLLVSQNVYTPSTVVTDKLVANTSTQTQTSLVTDTLDVSTGVSVLNIVTANNATVANGFVNVLQSNTLINAAFTNTNTLYAQSLSTPRANVTGVIDANSASGFLNNLQVNNQFSVQGNFVISGTTVYNSNTFTLNSGSDVALNSSYVVNRGSSGANAIIRWNETQQYWDLNDVSTDSFYRLLSAQQINNTLTSTSTSQVASAATANTLYTLLTAANTALSSNIATTYVHANSAFNRANAAYVLAENVAPQIAPAFGRANAAYDRANTSSNTIVGTTGQASPTNGSLTLTGTNGITVSASGNTISINNPQGLTTLSNPTFNSLTLREALTVTQGGTGAQDNVTALQNLLPTTVGVPAGYVLGTTGGLGASFSWVAGGTGDGGGGGSVGTKISTNRLVYTAAQNQRIFTTPEYVAGSGQLRIYVNGVRQYMVDYEETTPTSVTMVSALNSGDTVMIEVDGYYEYTYYANTIPFTAPFGGIVATANTVQLAMESIETRKAPLASPSFIGVPTAPKAALTTSNTQVAVTSWVTEWANSGYTIQSSITGNAGTVTNGVYTNGSYSNPSWLTLTKAKVGLSEVDNTADRFKNVNIANTANVAVTATAVTGITLQSGLGTTSATQFGSLGVGTPASGTNGEIRAYNNITAYYGQSDIRLKENIVPLQGALSAIDSINAYNFNYKTRPDQKMIGVIAQELMTVYPELVYETTPIDENTGLDKSYAVNYELLSVVLLQSIKELKAEVEELKGKTK